ncbi:ATPdependent RNA helicase DHX8, putative [Acanthamoeba castellanii str. Neff]|uniref:RNA helicase n=1 Tax=Acanthamoeba castellanii (strain ATCC 30010 / Neff) TaxID=1257118 RepID=L8H9J2_ACACF|nr:ATPdependent RNA helicase DHX8, putative [Acanthamoeba castellanii str. Neff]ELR22169.1 ATPdependent RNA helicase DHX8, putative [Acanthamoeba castellanii str. Neff]
MDEIEKLQLLSLVSKICTELENHLGAGMSDKVLAEFIVDIAEKNPTLPAFSGALSENGADFPEVLVEKLFHIIQRMKPSKAQSGGSAAPAQVAAAHSNVLANQFPGLAVPDNYAARMMKIVEEEEPVPPVADDRKRKREDDHEPASRDRERGDHHSRDRERDGRGRDDDRGRRGRDDDYDRDRRDRDRSRRSRSPDRHGRDRDRDRPAFKPPARDDDEPVKYKIYDGTVRTVKEFGCFVSLEGVRGRKEGLVHVSEIRAGGRLTNANDAIKRGEKVKVKVLGVAGEKVSLTMREVDQQTGKDLLPRKTDEDTSHNPSAPNVRVRSRAEEDESTPHRPIKRMSSPEKWEWKQLAAAGVVDAREMPGFDETNGVLNNVEENEEELEVELSEVEAPFLRGQTRFSHIQLSPIKVVRNPDGSLQRAAMTQSALSKERRELRDEQRKQMLDSIPKDLNRPWEDPMPEPGERHIAQELRGIGAPTYELPEWKKNYLGGSNARYGQATKTSIIEQRESLPIFKLREELLKAMHDNQLLVVIGETGSGKTTQMTQYLAEAGYASRGMIGCTQPRRVAAMSVAKRVAEEFGCRLGQEVGYAIRFEDCTSPETKIKYMTDGMLLRECLLDPDLSKYSVLMLDEAHERTIHTDVLFGLLKKATQNRPDLKLIITSATLDAEKFSTYFSNCPIFTIPGRTFPVEILYTKSPETDYLDAALITVMQIHLSEPPGDVLLFLTGQEEIDTACQILYERMKSLGPMVPELVILPVYSALPSEMQTRIFEPAARGSRKVVVATNIAETSVTIDGIYYVVDPGFVKQKVYNPKMGMDSLVVCPISQAAARQRAGRAGRTGPGKCYRLYTEGAYKNEMLPTSVPEIQRTNLANTVLTLKAMGINDMLGFDFMDPPPVQTLIVAMEQLYSLGALDEEGLLTRLGRKMAEFPLEPQLSKMLITSVELGCADEILTVVAMLSVQNVFYRPKEKQAQADQKKAKFHQVEGDHLTLLAVYEAWKSNNFSNPWCYENFIQARSMRRAQDIRKQLLTIMDRYKMEVTSAGKNYSAVRKAIVSGFFAHAARKDPQEGYKTLTEGQPVYIHPSSALFQKNPEWVIYQELVLTTKEYMREVLMIEPKWLVEFAPKFYRVSDPTKLSKRKRQEKVEPLFDKYREPNAWRLSKRRG